VSTDSNATEKAFVTRLVERAKSLDERDFERRFGPELGEIVYDLKGKERSETYNCNATEMERRLKEQGWSAEELAKMDAMEQLEALDDVYTADGESINNGGLLRQAEYLLGCFGPDPVEAADEVAQQMGLLEQRAL